MFLGVLIQGKPRQTRTRAPSPDGPNLDGIRELGCCSGDIRGLGDLEYGSDGSSD